jgi:purine-binding chemotaxis protein CheW
MAVIVVCGALACALPVRDVIETMRPLPVEPLRSAPDFVLGVTMVRGAPVPVVHLGRLLRGDDTPPQRFISLRVAERCVVLAVDACLGVRPLQPQVFQELPPLLSAAADVKAVTQLDAQLCLVLDAARLLPEAVE